MISENPKKKHHVRKANKNNSDDSIACSSNHPSKELSHSKEPFDRQIKIRRANTSDISKIVSLLKFVSVEADIEYQFNEAHAWMHISHLVCDGVSFLASQQERIVGVVMCNRVDLGFAPTNHLETHHLYVHPDARSTDASRFMLDALERYADSNDIALILHQMDYICALTGQKNNSKLVERFFKMRGYEGPIDTATAVGQSARVGISFRYPKRELAPQIGDQSIS